MITKVIRFLCPLFLMVPFFLIGASDDQKIYYVSSSQGSDSNDGTEERPLKSIFSSKIPKSGVEIRLKCGDVFYENIKAHNNDFSSYGVGAKPVISGWKILPKSNALWTEGRMNNGKWEEKKGTHIWRLDLNQTGFYGRVNSSEPYENNIGLIMESDTKRMHGRKCEFIYKEDCNDPYKNPQRNTYLKHNFDFAQTSKSKKSAQPSDYRYLYMYLDHNPSQHELMFSTYGNGIGAGNTKINGLRIEGFSCHGVACGSNVSISDCEIEYIGGAHQYESVRWVRYGNGVEFYVSKTRENGHVFNNRISHTFDCATTIQGSNHIGATAKNIVIEKNIIKNCRQAFEFFLSNSDKAKKINYDCVGCIFRKNICVDSGENGFESPEYRDTHILSYQKEYPTSMKIEGNTFVGGNGLYTATNPSMLRLGRNDYYYSGNEVVLWRSGMPKEVVMLKDRKNFGKDGKSVESVTFHQMSPEQLKAKRLELSK
ncbi:MAG: hypothetical protein J5767_05885 [Paludibacteraceae bacterium]|nr:hypothetical protein [Paludibacteraceae bacterium]